MGDTLVSSLRRDGVGAAFDTSMFNLDRIGGGFIAEMHSPRCNMNDLPVARNQAMKRLVESGYDWLLFVDSDMGFQASALADLRSVADPAVRPVVGALCFAQRDLRPDGCNGFRWTPRSTIMDYLDFPDGQKRFSFREYYPINRLVQCDATGCAFLLIHRTVAERMLNRFGPVWFDRIDVGEDGIMSEDLSFFKRLLDLDGPGSCHVHTGVKVTHQKDIWLGETDFWRAFDPIPATERVDVLVPVLHRPQNVRPLMESLTASTGLATAWFIVEPGDDEEIAEVVKYGGRVIEHPGSYAVKVNHAYERIRSGAPWVFLVGDDVGFYAGWLDHAQFVSKAFGAAVIGTNDLSNPRVMSGEHATHFMLHRGYVDELGASWGDVGPGKVCHEGYGHWFVDNEIIAAAKQRGQFQMAIGSLVEHMHPLFGKAEDDDVYRKGFASVDADKVLFEARSAEFGSAVAA